ncbi:MAG: TetR/AcrR family transcriptional regulator [Arenicella sp.]|jgi:TetR/AcrR family transcriptional regulator
MPTSPATTKPRIRRTQERASATRANLIAAGRSLFPQRGFDGVSLRDIEKKADVKRGLVAYHFEEKENFWKFVADEIFQEMAGEFEQRMAILHELPEDGRLSFLVRFHVGYHARNPELSRLMSQEAIQNTWRIDYLIETYIRPSLANLKLLTSATLNLTDAQFIHWYYIMISASSTVFSFAPECRQLFGVDPCENEFVEGHAKMLIDMLFKQTK